ncbi:hypothetical protein XM38_027190 [Halomicronema hongdechloris C2206]|uniref:Fe/B12 periplasmic-binding domain-containing protein n=2 Tax=Halomicronema hongdechloris TaxID=1209493 RepID=A0A1Z3HNB1_9CYAN|nr:hypothetical protein XM38_027190 [Halomicronema hongdechloris C2206]
MKWPCPTKSAIALVSACGGTLFQNFDADIIFVWTWGYTSEFAKDTEKLLESLKTDPLWLQLQAVKEGNVYEVPAYWMGDSILDAYAVIDDLFKYLVDDQ